MKKFLLVLTAILGMTVAANAQSKALGLRLGAYNSELSYEYSFGGADFLETELGAIRNSDGFGFRATGIYNWMIAQPNWTNRGEWGFYGGVGGSLGAAPYDDSALTFSAAVVGQLGLEYTFWFPLQLAIDIRPAIGLLGSHFYTSGLIEGVWPTLSIRYSF